MMSVIRITASLFLVTVIMVAPLYAQDEAAIPALDPAVSMPNLVVPEPAILSDTTAVVDVTDQEAMEIPAEGSDIVLILDNSSSMKTNDPQSQLAGAVTGFVAKLDETLMPGFNPAGDELIPESDEVILMPDHDVNVVTNPASVKAADPACDDETLMPEKFTGIEEDDAILRPSVNSSSDDIFDVTGVDYKHR